MTRQELFERLEKLDRKDTEAYVKLTVEADKADLLNPDTGEIIANSVLDQDAYFDGLDKALPEN